MKKKRKIAIILIIFVIILIVLLVNNNKTINMSEEDKQELMSILGIENSSSFLPISINQVRLDWKHSSSECYLLKFKISIEDYNKNSLKYKDNDTSEVSLNWKEKKDEQFYICYVREERLNDYRKELYNELRELYTKYWIIK